jgi:eukaryotic-like serine/threonine-protein kinase
MALHHLSGELHGERERRLQARGPVVGESVGAYRITSVLGRGASARVYTARDASGRTVGLKVLHTRASITHTLRLQLEAEVLQRIRSEHVVRARGNVETSGRWRYLVLESLPGRTLRDLEGPWPAARVIPIARQLSQALLAVHDASVIHCDVKPENIIVAQDRRGQTHLKLIDFDSARWLDHDAGRSAAVVPLGTAYGTPGYVAPELLDGADVDARADLWSFGALLYELATGALPPSGPWRVWRQRRALTAAGFPPAFVELVLACLSEHPEDRPPSMAAVGRVLGAEAASSRAA